MTKEEIRDILIHGVKERAKQENGIICRRPEADSYALFAVLKDGRLLGYNYADGITWEDINLSDLAYIFEHGESGVDESCLSG